MSSQVFGKLSSIPAVITILLLYFPFSLFPCCSFACPKIRLLKCLQILQCLHRHKECWWQTEHSLVQWYVLRWCHHVPGPTCPKRWKKWISPAFTLEYSKMRVILHQALPSEQVSSELSQTCLWCAAVMFGTAGSAVGWCGSSLYPNNTYSSDTHQKHSGELW